VSRAEWAKSRFLAVSKVTNMLDANAGNKMVALALKYRCVRNRFLDRTLISLVGTMV
jgi:hypothetical protein